MNTKAFKTLVEMKSKISAIEWRAVCEYAERATIHEGDMAQHAYFAHELQKTDFDVVMIDGKKCECRYTFSNPVQA